MAYIRSGKFKLFKAKSRHLNGVQSKPENCVAVTRELPSHNLNQIVSLNLHFISTLGFVGSTISFKDKTTYPSSGVQGNSTLRRAKLTTENKTTAQSKFSC